MKIQFQPIYTIENKYLRFKSFITREKLSCFYILYIYLNLFNYSKIYYLFSYLFINTLCFPLIKYTYKKILDLYIYLNLLTSWKVPLKRPKQRWISQSKSIQINSWVERNRKDFRGFSFKRMLFINIDVTNIKFTS